ncbi:MAG: hypothetical protein AMXMBFR61_09550 [Fimbriimonadales bacterium]
MEIAQVEVWKGNWDMSTILKTGQRVYAVPMNVECKVETFLGDGTQGEVYEATLEGQPVAIKWYKPRFATPSQRASLVDLAHRGAPSDKFIWPLAVAECAGVPGFGYVMPLRPQGFVSVTDRMLGRVKPSFRSLCTLCYHLADSFLTLHAAGLCYRDVNAENVSFEPQTGDIRILDNDNVTVNKHPETSLLGTPRYMAPEIVRGESPPSTDTDLFSLAVLLFYMLHVHHPLEGAAEAAIHCLDLPAMRRLYGTHPVFIYDPNDDSNRPVKGYHDNALFYWPLYPQRLRDLFTQAFTQGLQPRGRVGDSEWRKAFVQARDLIVYCGRCGKQNFLNSATGGQCWKCKSLVQSPPRLRVGEWEVALNYDAKLYRHHISKPPTYDFTTPIAEMAEHPTEPGRWGLKNLSEDPWMVTKSDGTLLEVPPGKSAAIYQGQRIRFGAVEGEVVA